MAEKAGDLYYDIEMDVRGLLTAQQQVNSRLDQMEQRFNDTGRAVESAERSMGSLSKVATALTAALSVQQVAHYADAWTTLNNKLANSIRTGEDLATVTQRVFDITQSTRSSLDATASLYARLERATREYGTSASDVARLTTIINQGFVVSGATAQEAENAIIQLSQGLASGALRGEEFNSVNEQGNRLIVALADSMGVSIGQMRNMAAQGKLTTDVVVKGLLSQGSVIGKEFANTTTTISQGMQIASNNITQFIGSSSTVKTVVSIFNDSVITLSSSLETVSSIILALVGITGSRYVGALTAANAAKLKDIAASISQARAANQTAQSESMAANMVTRRAVADKEAAISALNLAQAEYNVARGTNAEILALTNLSQAKQRALTATVALTEAQNAQSAATARASLAASSAATGIRGLATGALGLIGGPAGAATLAAAAVFYFYQKAQQAKQESIDFADKLDGVIAKMKEMNQTQLGAEIAKAQQSVIDQKDAISDLRDEMSALEQKKTFIEQAASIRGSTAVAEDYQQVQRDIAIQAGKVDAAETKLSQTVNKVGILRAQLNGNLAQGIDLLKRDGDQAGVAAGLMNQFGSALNLASRQKDKFNSSSLKVERPKNVQDYLDKLLDQVEIEGTIDERKRAQLKAEKEIRALGGDDGAIRIARERAGAEYDAVKAQQTLKKETRDSTTEGKKAETQAQAIAQKLSNLKQESELAATSTQDLSREQAMLRAEQSLGKSASSEQIQQARDYAAATWDAAAAIKARNAVPELKEMADYNSQKSQLKMLQSAKDAQGNLLINQQQYSKASEQLEQDHQTKLAQIRAEQVVTPQQQAAGLVDPVQALANENAKKLALIQQFEQQKLITEQQGLALRNAANTEFEQKRVAAQWEIWRQQSAGNEAAAAAFDSFAGNASNALTGIITGSMSAQEAMRSLGSTVLNSLVNSFVQMGVEWVKSAVMGATAQTTAVATTTAASVAGTATTTAASTAAAATTVAAWTPAAIVASIGSFGGAAAIGIGAVLGALAMGVAGKRKNGGPVTAGGMYQVGESGLPEIYQASTGKQYMIPGDNGKVISNKDMQSGSGMNVVVNFNDYASGDHSYDYQASQSGNTLTIDAFIMDISNGGQMSQAISSFHNAPRKARGS